MTTPLLRSYRLDDWLTWDDQVHAFASNFRERFGLYPNVLVASDATHRRIAMASKPANLRGPKGESATPGEYHEISAFCTEAYELEFYEGDELAEKAILLMWESEPGGGGEADIDDEEEEPAPIAHVA